MNTVEGKLKEVEATVQSGFQELMKMIEGLNRQREGHAEQGQASVHSSLKDDMSEKGDGANDGERNEPNGNGVGGPNGVEGGGPNPDGVGRPEEQSNWRKRVELPVFEGFDPLNWINRAEKFFELQGVTEEEKLRLAYICMEGSAGFWFRFWREQTGNRTWTGLKEAMV